MKLRYLRGCRAQVVQHVPALDAVVAVRDGEALRENGDDVEELAVPDQLPDRRGDDVHLD